jgi:heme exporter protein D
MNHLGFIAAAYGVTTIVLVAMVAWLVLDGRAVTRRLSELDARGVRRRSAQPGTSPQ